MSLLPKPPSSENSSPAYRTGTLVIFDQDGASQTAVILEIAKNKAKILTMRERQMDLAFGRISLLPGTIPSDHQSHSEKATYLLSLRDTALEASQTIPLEELWSFVEEESREFTCDELCELYYGANDLTHHLALRFALQEDPVYFKRKKHHFEPRPKATIDELKKAEATRKEKERALRQSVEAMSARLEDSSYEFSQEVLAHLRLLEKVAAGAPHLDNAEHKEAKKLLDLFSEKLSLQLGGGREERAYEFLRRLHHFHRNTNLSFLRHGLPEPFSEATCQEAEALSSLSSFSALTAEEQAFRVDLTHLDSLTIDDESTKDMDDALSIERTEDGYRLGIHITDVAACIPTNSALDRDAKERATSLYFPEGTYNMFPEILSEERLSLRVGEPRRALSILIEVDRLFEIQSHSIVPSVIEVKRRLTYDEVDQALLLEQGDEFLLYQIAMSCEAHRLANGGMNIPKRDVSVSLDNPGNLAESSFDLAELDEKGPARSLIGEMMILANNYYALFAQQHNFPLLFRSQEDPDEEKRPDLSQIPPGPAQDYAMRLGLKRSEISVTPARHSTLGLEAYAQVTSPIRRYGDLCNQRQILSFLKEGEACLSAEQLEQAMAETAETNQRARLLTRETKRFWLLKYLKKKKSRKENIQATILRDDMKNYLVELEEIYIPAYLKKSTKLTRGDVVELEITAVDPRYDYLKLGFRKKV